MTTPAELRARRRGMTQNEQVRDTETKTLQKWAKRGAPLAIEELMRRENYFQIPHGGRSDFERGCIVESMQPDWRA